MIIDTDNRSLKYKILLSAFRVLPVKKLMAASPEKTQKLFCRVYKGADVPTLHYPALLISQKEVAGSKVLYARHKEKSDRVGIYLVGGGMRKYPKPSQAKEIMKLATGNDAYLLSPMLCDLSGFPPIDVFYGTKEIMIAYLEDFKDVCEKYHVPLTVHIGEGMMHCWGAMDFVPEAQAVRREYFAALQ